MGTYTKLNLDDIDDSATTFGFGEFQESRFATKPLGAKQTGMAHHRIKPGQRSPISRRHRAQEELYVVIAGSGRAKIGDELVEFGTGDLFRVDADVVRGWEAGPDGAEILAFGAPVVDEAPDQGELVDDHWD